MVREVGAGTLAGGAGTVSATGAETIERMNLGTGTVAGVGTVREAGGRAVTGTEVEVTTVGEDTGTVGATVVGAVRGIEARTNSAAGIETGVALTLANGTGITGLSTNFR
jgi:hypothetical protein